MTHLGPPRPLKAHYGHLWLTVATVCSPQPPWAHHSHRWLITATFDSLRPSWVHHGHPGLTIVTLGSLQPHWAHCSHSRLTIGTPGSLWPSWAHDGVTTATFASALLPVSPLAQHGHPAPTIKSGLTMATFGLPWPLSCLTTTTLSSSWPLLDHTGHLWLTTTPWDHRSHPGLAIVTLVLT